MITTEPPPAVRRCGRPARSSSAAWPALNASVAANSPGPELVMLPPPTVPPALATRRSRPPNAAATSSTACCSADASMTSAATVATGTPRPSRRSAAAARPSALRATSPTATPSAASAPAIANPMPLLPPVITARLPFRPRSMCAPIVGHQRMQDGTPSSTAKLRGLQGDQPGLGRAEAAAAGVERAQVLLEVDVQPLAPRGASLLRRDRHHPGADPMAPGRRRDQGVEDERVHTAIPCDVDEAHQLAIVAGADPAETVPGELCLPVVIEQPMAKALRVQSVQLGIAHRAAPLVTDHRDYRNDDAARQQHLLYRHTALKQHRKDDRCSQEREGQSSTDTKPLRWSAWLTIAQRAVALTRKSWIQPA